MKEHPILYSTPMVQAILQGRKTITRRVVKPQPRIDKQTGDVYLKSFNEVIPVEEWAQAHAALCPYGKVGDKLWVRETFAVIGHTTKHYVYKADAEGIPKWEDMKWKPSIFMPRAACRITLQITSEKVERLQDITEDQAIAEGIFYNEGLKGFTSDNEGRNFHASDPRKSFMKLWIAINGEDSWDANPFVWAIGFNKL